MNRLSILLLFFYSHLVSCINTDKEKLQQVSWTGSSHSIFDTLISVDLKDTLFNFKYFYMAHHISFDENGDVLLITRNEYDSPRQLYKIEVNDSVRQLITNLLKDTSILNFKQPVFNPEKQYRLYCGYGYLISIQGNDKQKININYIPPDANSKLRLLHEVFETIWNQPKVIGYSQVDTITLDSVIFEKVILFNPGPPVRSTVKFKPPIIKSEDEMGE
jgi:hypothetical protein